MLSLFRTNQLIANVLLIFYVILLRFSGLIVTNEYLPSHPGVLSDHVLAAVPPEGILSHVLAMVLVFTQALFINIIAAKYRVARTVSLIPGLFYVLLTSCFPDYLYLSPPLMANTFLIFALYELLGCYKQYYSNGRIYNAGLWIGLACLFYFSSIIFLIPVFISFVILRAFKLKEQIGMLLGMVTPFWLLGIYYYVSNQSSLFWGETFGSNIAFFDIPPFHWMGYIQIGFFAIMVLFAIFSYRSYTYKVSIQAQKFIDVFFWFLIFSSATLLLQKGVQADHLLLLVPPLSLLIGMTFLYMNNRFAEALHLLLLAGIFLLQFEPFWYIGG